jgi:hypothetical protein
MKGVLFAMLLIMASAFWFDNKESGVITVKM